MAGCTAAAPAPDAQLPPPQPGHEGVGAWHAKLHGASPRSTAAQLLPPHTMLLLRFCWKMGHGMVGWKSGKDRFAAGHCVGDGFIALLRP
jgi:hypothetical protein